MASELNLTTWTDTRPWVSTGTRLQQKTESLDLQFQYGVSTYRNAIRFLANGDVRLFGELVSESGSLRAYATFSMTVYGAGDEADIVSFRNGKENVERLRVTGDGTLQAATDDTLKLSGASVTVSGARSGTATSWGSIRFDPTTTERVLDCSDATVTDPLRIRAQELRLDAWDPYSAAFDRWGRFTIENFSNTPRRLSAQNTAGTTKDLELEGADVKLRTLSTLGGVDLWGSFERGVLGSLLFIPNHTFIQAKSGSTNKNIWLECEKFIVTVHNQDTCARFEDGDAVVRYQFKMTGQQTVTALSDQHASLTLDSSATTGAKKWTIRADKGGSPAGSLKFVNETDGGTPTIEMDASGGLYAPGYVGMKTTSAAPSDSDGRVGAVAVDTTNKRLWVKVASSGTGRWWYTTLVQP